MTTITTPKPTWMDRLLWLALAAGATGSLLGA
jgi:hypothetical protein